MSWPKIAVPAKYPNKMVPTQGGWRNPYHCYALDVITFRHIADMKEIEAAVSGVEQPAFRYRLAV